MSTNSNNAAKSERAQYIASNYSLTKAADGRWHALNLYQGRVWGEFFGTREEVIRNARCQWGHFNFEDEAAEFNRIFR